MLNRNSTNSEAKNSGDFLKNYIDSVEELPNDIQKCISRYRDLDYKTRNLTCQIEKFCQQMLSKPTHKKSRIKMQQLLAKLTDLKDEKVLLSQTLNTFIESKQKKVTESFQNYVSVRKERNQTPSTQQNITLNTVKQLPSVIPNESNPSAESVSVGRKRGRKRRVDVNSNNDNQPPPIKTQSTSNNSKKTSNINVPAKKVKRRKTTKKQDDDDDDPDEPTYCICQKISYGEMILCDNDKCPIEWYHFSCVELTIKPKGRWFCPQCRGDKANVINKDLRLKQLESSSSAV